MCSKRLAVLISGLLLLLLFLFTDRALATTYYVRSSGSDAPDRDGLRPATAFASIGRAAEEAGAGSAVIVGPGRYAEGNIRPRGKGQRSEPIVFFADRLGELTGDHPGEVIVDASGFESGFKLSGGRQWVIVNGFTVTNAVSDGIFVKDMSHNCAIVNCILFSNGRRGILVRDSSEVVVFNNLVYTNADAGVVFEGAGRNERLGVASPRGVVINNTIYGNGDDGLRIEEDMSPSEDMTVLNNVVAGNLGIGVNLKEGSKAGFVGQWNLVHGNTISGYNTLATARGSLDIENRAVIVEPAGSDGTLGGSGYKDDNFHLAQASTGHPQQSPAVNASALKAKELDLAGASTRIDGQRDTGPADLGFHAGNESDSVSRLRKKKKGPVWKVPKSFQRRVKKLRKKATTCEKKVQRAIEKLRLGRGPCVKTRSRARLARRCGSAVNELCL